MKKLWYGNWLLETKYFPLCSEMKKKIILLKLGTKNTYKKTYIETSLAI